MSAASLNPIQMRPLLTSSSRHYWTAGSRNELCLLRDRQTGRWIHPFAEGDYAGARYAAQAVSGHARLFTFTRSYLNPASEQSQPLVIALVTLVEQDDLRIPTKLVNCNPSELFIGIDLCVRFEQSGDIFLPVFEPLFEPVVSGQAGMFDPLP